MQSLKKKEENFCLRSSSSSSVYSLFGLKDNEKGHKFFKSDPAGVIEQRNHTLGTLGQATLSDPHTTYSEP